MQNEHQIQPSDEAKDVSQRLGDKWSEFERELETLGHHLEKLVASGGWGTTSSVRRSILRRGSARMFGSMPLNSRSAKLGEQPPRADWRVTLRRYASTVEGDRF